MRAVLVLALSLGVLASGPAVAQLTAAKTAEQAAQDLRVAIDALKAAESGKDRISALTATIRAYETGLAALRDSMRVASVREAEIAKNFEARRQQIGQLLGVMTTMESSSEPLLLLHPAGPLSMARSEMILSSVAPAVQTEADALRAQLTELKNIRALQQETADTLQKGLVAVQTARAALAKAMQDRTDLPDRYIDDPEELRALVDNADTLDAFSVGLSKMENDIGAPLEDFAGAQGALPLPVFGSLLRKAGTADAAGVVRPGILVATRPAALVTAPWPATIRYRGPLLDYGNVMIIEPARGYLLVLAGLGTVFGETGDVVAQGAPLGLMSGSDADEASLALGDQKGSGADHSETLYIEIRKDGAPLDPAPWFAETKDK